MAVSMPVTGNLQFVHHQSIDVKITGRTSLPGSLQTRVFVSFTVSFSFVILCKLFVVVKSCA